VVGEVADFLARRAEAGTEAGVGEVWIDPGIGFGKTAEHNLALLAGLSRLADLGYPVLVGASRKRFLGVIGAGPEGYLAERDRLEPSLAVAVWAYDNGAAMVRAHDVAATAAAATIVTAGVAW